MRIVLRDENRQLIGRIDVDPAARPTRVVTEAIGANGFPLSALGIRQPKPTETPQNQAAVPALEASNLSPQGSPADNSAPPAPSLKPYASKEVFLSWDTALDDAGQLRRCVACGCTDLFKEKAFPQVTAVIVVLAFIGAVIGALGLANTPVLWAMLVILVLDVAILLLSRRRLVCYRCRSTFHDLPIARYHRSWDRSLADRHPAPTRGVPAPLAEATPAQKPATIVEAAEPVEQTNYFASS